MQNNVYDVIIIGGGASGMMAGIKASEFGANVLIIEHNEKLGKKLYITGKGRCNLTNLSSVENHIQNINNGSLFMQSALNAFTAQKCVEFFNKLGLPTKIERGNRVFPVSDKSSDVIKVLEKKLCDNKVNIIFNKNVNEIKSNGECYILCCSKQNYTTKCVCVCCGGKSYSATGSDGSGYDLAKKMGHSMVDLRPALVPILLIEDVKNLAGLSLKNVSCSIIKNEKLLAIEFGEMLFTHVGVSGPAVLTLSSRVNRYDIKNATFSIDLKPALSLEKLDEKFLREFPLNENQNISNYLKNLMPKALVEPFMQKAHLENKKICQITKTERKNIAKTLKSFDFIIDNLDNMEYGIITSGGIELKEINPKTMESKKCKNAYFAGEILNIDAMTGGYNLQIAFATGFVAGSAIAEKLKG